MKQIASFSVDHIKMQRGIFCSRKDQVGSEIISTFDIRMKLPNREKPMDIAPLHTIEHLGAVFLRNHPIWSQKTIYFGPMGCRTGCYALFAGDLSSDDIADVITEMTKFIADFEGDIPGATAVECGNYLDHDLTAAKKEADIFLTQTLQNLTRENLSYPPAD